MVDINLIKRWKISETLLKQAHRLLPTPSSSAEKQFQALEKEFLSCIDNNEHEFALDKLEELGELVSPRGGFWKYLILAAENLDLHKRIPYFQKKFEEAITRMSEKPDDA
jgi:hypothetical protein